MQLVNLTENETQTISAVKSDEKNYLRLFQITQLITGLYLLPFISLFGIVGSVFNLLVYKNSKKCSTHVYLIALSLSDIVKLVNDFLYFIISLISKLDESLGTKIFNSIYLYSHYIFVFTAINTAWLTCVIAFDRYIAVVANQNKKRFRSYTKSILISIVVMIMSILFAIPSPLFLQFNSSGTVESCLNNTFTNTSGPINDSSLNKTMRKTYNYLNAVIRAFIPLILISYLNLKILQVIYKNKMKKKFKKTNKTASKIKTKSSITLMLFLIVFTFTICMLPDAIMTMMQIGYANEGYMVRSIREVTDLLLAVNSSTTFPICYYFSIQYRDMFKEIFCKNCTKQDDESLREDIGIQAIDYEENTVFIQDKKRIGVTPTLNRSDVQQMI